MNNRRRFGVAAPAALILACMLGGIGCSDKTAAESTPTATSAGKPGANSEPQQPSEQGKAANGGNGNQVPSPVTPPP